MSDGLSRVQKKRIELEHSDRQTRRIRRKQGRAALIAFCCVAGTLLVAFAGYRICIFAEDVRRGEELYAVLAQYGPDIPPAQVQAADSDTDLRPQADTHAEVADSIDFSAIDFGELQNINRDVCAWIYIGNTPVNYPVVHAPENDNNYYVGRTFERARGGSGAIFVDCGNSADFTDKNTTIYGHNMRKGHMFATLHELKAQDYFDSHTEAYLVTPGQIYKLEIFTVFETNYSVPYRTREFADDDEFMAFVREYQSKSRVRTDVAVSPDDRIVTLTTCSKAYDGALLAVMAKLTPCEAEGERR